MTGLDCASERGEAHALRRLFAVLALAGCLAPGASFGGGPALSPTPAPETVLGFSPGDDGRLAEWSAVRAYFQVLAAASPRVRLEEVGPTTEGRPFLIATITSAANQSRLEEIRRDNLRLAEPRRLSAEEAARLVEGRSRRGGHDIRSPLDRGGRNAFGPAVRSPSRDDGGPIPRSLARGRGGGPRSVGEP